MNNEIKVLGKLNISQWRESRRRIYSVYGVAPTLHGVGMGVIQSLKS